MSTEAVPADARDLRHQDQEYETPRHLGKAASGGPPRGLHPKMISSESSRTVEVSFTISFVAVSHTIASLKDGTAPLLRSTLVGQHNYKI
jgi:hypothetical protein